MQANTPNRNTVIQLQAQVQRLPYAINIEQAFAELTNHGNSPGSILYENTAEDNKFSQMKIATYKPSMMICGKGSKFTLHAYDQAGELLLPYVATKFPEKVAITAQNERQITGSLAPDLTNYALDDRLNAVNHMDLIRALQFTIESNDNDVKELPLGLLGCFGYDFVRQFEALPPANNDILQDPDYIFYLATKMLIVDQQRDLTYLIVLAPKHKFINSTINFDVEMQVMLDAVNKQDLTTSSKQEPVQLGEFKSDTCYEDYKNAIHAIKQAIHNGETFQTVLGRTIQADFSGDAFSVYQTLKRINPSPHMFYMRDAHGTLLGASPELALRVSQTDHGNIVEIHPIAGTRKRGYLNGELNQRLDQHQAMSLLTDPKEMAEHTMLIDLARNDVASIAKPGTTQVDKAFTIEKYAHVQHIVSKVSGILADEYDALTAYLATMNMGTLTGAPKPSALQFINQYETNARGFFGGGFGFITHQGELETAIVIRSMRIKNQTVYIRAGGGIVADSQVENEWEETENKAASCIKALQQTQQQGVAA